MGWTGYYRAPGEDDLGHFQRELFPTSGQQILAGATLQSTTDPAERVFFGAVKEANTDEVWCLIVLQHGRGESYARKELQDSMGVFGEWAPDSVLDLLTPTDNETSNEWRQQSREHNARKRQTKAARPKLSNGTRFRVERPWEFVDGTKEDTFVVVDSRRRHYRRATDGRTVRLPARSRWPKHEVVN